MRLIANATKRTGTTILSFLFLLSMTASAQEIRSEVSVQGTGFFTKESNGNGTADRTTETGGVLVGYRYNITRWLAGEANYGYDRNTQRYFGLTPERIQSNIHQITGSAVFKLPGFARIQPYVLAGGGALIFDPTARAGSIFPSATQETKGTFLYGGGVDYVLARHFSLRAEYRGLVYKSPSFNLAKVDTNAWTHIAQPSAGIAFRF